MRQTIPVLVRLFERTLCRIDGRRCWEWQGYVGKTNGYGYLTVKGTGNLVHRLSYQLHNGEIGHGLDVCHSCDNRRCINPDHLWLGTRQQNQSDMSNKNRSAQGERNGAAKLTRDDIISIRNAEGKQSEIAKKFGVNQGQVSRIKMRTRWGHVV